jgi:hypothetical protein
MPGMPPVEVICSETYIFFEKKHPELNPLSLCFRLKPWLFFDIIHLPIRDVPGRGLLSSYAHDHWYGDLLLQLEAGWPAVAVAGASLSLEGGEGGGHTLTMYQDKRRH